MQLDNLRDVLKELQDDMFKFDDKIHELDNLKEFINDKINKLEDHLNDLTSE